MRVGIIALLHESNTFVPEKTVLRNFEQDLLLTGELIRERLADSRHEIGGFFQGLANAGIEAVPIFVARALPSGTIEAETFSYLVDHMLRALSEAGQLDGILAAPHGATVAENHPDADGHWLSRVRELVGTDIPIIATIDPHANLSRRMVDATDAVLAYRTNPHIDQEETGMRAAGLMADTLVGKVKPAQAAAFPPMAINIQSQETAKPPLSEFYSEAAKTASQQSILSHSIVLGFPYSDVEEIGSSIIAVTDSDPELAAKTANTIGEQMWQRRTEFEPDFISIESAIKSIESAERTLLLDMGDNVGGGSSADGTWICSELERHAIGPAFVCICDPDAVKKAEVAGPGTKLQMSIGGRTDKLHGAPLNIDCTVISLHDGSFREEKVRHGGIGEFHQGRTAVVRTTRGLTVLLTSRRVPPFSLEQLYSCGLDPRDFAVIIAKGVIAPLAAYGPVCDRVIHVNSPGSTCADMTQLKFKNRRRPLFPFER